MGAADRNVREWFAPGRLWSLWDMFDVNASNFLAAIQKLAEARALINNATAMAQDPLAEDTIRISINIIDEMMPPIFNCGAKSAWVSASRTLNRLKNKDASLTFGLLGTALADIESRFTDHLGFIRMYVVAEDRSHLMSDASSLINNEVSINFTDAIFDFEESAKCLCLDRATASVFHSMRALEVGIKALAKRLGVPDPVKSADRNWGKILEKVKDKIDKLYPAQTGMQNLERNYFERIYVLLEAIRNPWRNSTMHVESVYTLEEAEHIFNCTKSLFNKMAEGFDQEGRDQQQKAMDAFSHVVQVPKG